MYILHHKPTGKMGETIEVRYQVHSDFEWISCPDGCDSHWDYDGKTFTPPKPPDPTPRPLPKLNGSAERRRRIRDAGVTFDHQMQALWDFVADGDDTKLKELKAKIADIL